MLAANDLFQVNMVGSIYNQLIMLTHYYTVLDTPAGVTEAQAMTELLDEIRSGGGADEWETAYRALLPIDYVLQRITAQKIAPIRYRGAFVTRNIAGSHAAGTEAPNQSAALTFVTLLSGRSQQATKKIGPIPQGPTVQANGSLTPEYVTLLGNLGSKMILDLTGAGPGATYSPVIAHRSPVGSYTLITDAIPQTTIRAVTRRTVGRGK